MQVIPGSATHVFTVGDARVVGQRVADPQRRHPVLVISQVSAQPWVDDAEVASRLRGHADVYVMEPGLAEELSHQLPGATGVFGLAARVYPGRDVPWLQRPDLSRYIPAGPGLEATLAEKVLAVVPGRRERRRAAARSRWAQELADAAGRRVVDLTDAAAVGAMLDRVLDPQRTAPVVVETRAEGTSRPFVDADQVLAAAPHEVEVATLDSGPLTFDIERRLGSGCGVYGGAARLYPPGTNWLHDPWAAPLHLASTLAEGTRATDRIMDDLAFEVEGARQRAWQAQPGPAASTLPAPWALEGYVVGAVVAARVIEVDDEHARVTLHPGVECSVPTALVSANELDAVSDLLETGEVVRVRVVGVGDASGHGWAVSMLDVDDDEPVVPCPPASPGEGPWLTVDDGLPEPPASSPDGVTRPEAAPAPLPPAAPQADLQRWRDRARRAEEASREHYEQLHSARQDNERLRQRLTRARQEGRMEEATPSQMLFAGVDEWRWQVLLAWAQLVPAGEKAERPLPPYFVGPEFLASLAELDGMPVAKAAKAWVKVLLGWETTAHPLRSSAGGSAPPVRVGDAVCWRAPVEQSTPSARRLHYWRKPSAPIELSRIGVHDDLRPGAPPRFTGHAGPLPRTLTVD